MHSTRQKKHTQTTLIDDVDEVHFSVSIRAADRRTPNDSD